MGLFSFTLAIIVIYSLYVRYVPVCCIPMLSLQQIKKMQDEKVTVIDLRDYNDSNELPIENAILLPLAYLKRNYHKLPYKEVILIVSDHITKNMGVRKLKQYGFKIKGVCYIGKQEQAAQTKIKMALKLCNSNNGGEL